MAELELGPLSDRLSDDEIADLGKKLAKAGAPALPAGDDSHSGTVGEAIEDRLMTEFLDRLDGHDIAAEIYVPVEFDGVFEVAGLRIGSLQALVDALEEVHEELALDEDVDEEDEEDDDDRAALDEQLRELWESFQEGASSALERRLPLHVKIA
jgi:hypothetical protein